MSDNRTNRVPKLEPLSHFFVELNSPNWATQTAAQSYGPVSEDAYRVTSSFSSETDLKAYAMCKGTILIVQQAGMGNENKINLILKPFIQPIKGLAIKYFVYRGLNKSDFIDGENADGLLIPSYGNPSNTELIKKIWEYYLEFNEIEPNNAGDFLAKWIGFNSSVSDSEIVDNIFFRINTANEGDSENKEFELVMVEIGEQIGNFNGDFGLDIILSSGDLLNDTSITGFYADMEFVRAKEWIFSSVQTDVPEGYTAKQHKEAILQFIDISAFIGLHMEELGVVKYRSISTLEGAMEEFTGIDIYENIMMPFQTKDTVYLEIISELGRSYDFYGHYSSVLVDVDSNIRVGNNTNNLMDQTYQSQGWPIHIFNINNGGNNRVDYFIELIFLGKANLYGEFAFISNLADSNFILNDRLKNQSNFTNTIQLSYVAYDGVSVSSFSKLFYEGVVLKPLIPETYKLNKDYYSLFLALTNVGFKSPIITSHDIISWGGVKNNSIVDISNATSRGVVQLDTRLINDKIKGNNDNEELLNRLTFESIVMSSSLGYSARGRKLLNETILSMGFYNYSTELDNHYRIDDPLEIVQSKFTYEGVELLGLKFKRLPSGNFFKYVIGISYEEYEAFNGIAINEGLKNCSLVLSEKIEDNPYSEPSDTDLVYGELLLLGEDLYGVFRKSVQHISIVCYSLDHHLFFSENYASRGVTSLGIDHEVEPTELLS